MKIRLWGTRGSIPVSPNAGQVRERMLRLLELANGRHFADSGEMEDFLDHEAGFALAGSYGGSSACVEVETGADGHVLFDMGSGLRSFWQQRLATAGLSPDHYRIFLSHVHWDHIMGFPFFTPAYVPGNRIEIHGCHGVIEETLRRQHSAPNFPVDWETLGADIRIVTLPVAEKTDFGHFSVTPHLQPHEGDSYGYRLECGGKSVVYSTDGEHKMEDEDEVRAYVDFIRDADLVIFDAMYSMAASMTLKEDWGHSSNIVGLDLCRQAGVRHYCMFHHEPIHDDATLAQILTETRRYQELTPDEGNLEISLAYDGMEIVL
jgi:phosphoribosyl 1,2-cyclic phosphodiesterase